MSTLTSDGSQLQDSEKLADSADSATPSQPLKSTNAKQSAIQRACEACDSRELIYLALSPGGLLDDSLRKRACRSVTHQPRFVLMGVVRADLTR